MLNTIKRSNALVRYSLNKYDDKTVFMCFLCDHCTKNIKSFLDHLLDEHLFFFHNPLQIPLLDQYCRYLKIQSWPCINVLVDGTCYQTIDVDSLQDIEIRKNLHRKRLEAVLRIHKDEQTVKHYGIKCLFCPEEFNGTWHQYLRFLLEEHQLDLGRPSNLVYINDFFDILRQKFENNICIYCNTEFPNLRTLKAHLQRKNHAKIPKNNPLYNRFYIINYLELDGTIHNAELISKRETPLIKHALEDFNNEITCETCCLLCDFIFKTIDLCIDHMHKEHKFLFSEIYETLNKDLYSCIKMINYIRYCKIRSICYLCNKDVKGTYSEHITSHNNPIPPKLPDAANKEKFLIPVIDSDPLLTVIETTEYDDDFVL